MSFRRTSGTSGTDHARAWASPDVTPAYGQAGGTMDGSSKQASGPPPKVQGCVIPLGCGSLAFVEGRYVIIRWGSKEVSVIELPTFILFVFLWCSFMFLGWLAYSHADPNPFTPGHILMDLFILVSVSYVFGKALSRVVHLPPLFGYLIIGMFVRNIPGNPTKAITEAFAAIAKEVALCIIVCRAGLGLPVLQFLGEPHIQRRNAFPPDEPSFAQVQAGMPVRLIPEGQADPYDGVVSLVEGERVHIRWNPEPESGPPPDITVSDYVSRRWWEKGAQARAFRRKAGQHPSVGDLSSPKWESLSTGAKVKQTLAKAKSGLALACTPMGLEGMCYCGLAIAVLQFDPIWGLMLGFVMAAVSPAVVVPGLIDLQKRGFVGGGNSGTPVPALVIFASGLDDVLAITFFGVFFGIAFGGADPTPKIVKAPLEVIGGVLLGVIAGTVLFWIGTLFEEEIPTGRAARALAEMRSARTLRPTTAVVQEQELMDGKKFGVAHADGPMRHGTSTNVPKIPQAFRSNTFVSALVFVVCILEVIGLAHVTVGAAGELASTGVLGAMCTCLVFNYHCAKDAYSEKWFTNEAKLLLAIASHDSRSGPDVKALQRDATTIKFFNAKQGEFTTLARECEKKVQVHSMLGERRAKLHADLEMFMKSVWDLAACPVLFALVGKSIVFSDLFNPEVLPYALLLIFAALLARCVGAVLACTGSGWPMKNRLFVALAWMPKATVQAAVGGLALSKAEENCQTYCGDEQCSGLDTVGKVAGNLTLRAAAALGEAATVLAPGDARECTQTYKDQLDWAQKILQISVVGIIITAPLGAAAIAVLGPRWLEQVIHEAPLEDATQPYTPPGSAPPTPEARTGGRSPRRGSKTVSGLHIPNSARRAVSGLSSAAAAMPVPVARTMGHTEGDSFAQAAYQMFARSYAEPVSITKEVTKSHLDYAVTVGKAKLWQLREYLKTGPDSAPIDINEHVMKTGHRPPMRQRYRIKRSGSWPTSLAMFNPRDVADLWALEDAVVTEGAVQRTNDDACPPSAPSFITSHIQQESPNQEAKMHRARRPSFGQVGLRGSRDASRASQVELLSALPDFDHGSPRGVRSPISPVVANLPPPRLDQDPRADADILGTRRPPDSGITATAPPSGLVPASALAPPPSGVAPLTAPSGITPPVASTISPPAVSYMTPPVASAITPPVASGVAPASEIVPPPASELSGARTPPVSGLGRQGSGIDISQVEVSPKHAPLT
eukprot:Hpha_TRINITY_DN15738_c1_g1::TRINITY_DN15738_c1_g1_i2::g.39004::m.39004